MTKISRFSLGVPGGLCGKTGGVNAKQDAGSLNPEAPVLKGVTLNMIPAIRVLHGGKADVSNQVTRRD